MIEILTCIFTGIIAASSVCVVLFTTFIYDGRNCMEKAVDVLNKKAGCPTENFKPSNLWRRLTVMCGERKMNRIIRKSR